MPLSSDSAEMEALRGDVVGLGIRAVDALRAMAAGGPGAWRTVEEVLLAVEAAGGRAALAEVARRRTAGGRPA